MTTRRARVQQLCQMFPCGIGYGTRPALAEARAWPAPGRSAGKELLFLSI
jgi:hypothetical protein